MSVRYRRAVAPAIFGAFVMLTAACTQLNDQDRALLTDVKTTADRAAANAAAAQTTAGQAATEAGRAATEAKAAADAARAAQASAAAAAADAKAADEKADRMFKRSLRKQ